VDVFRTQCTYIHTHIQPAAAKWSYRRSQVYFPYKVAVYQQQLGRVTAGGDLGHVKGSGVGKFDCEYIEDGWEWY